MRDLTYRFRLDTWGDTCIGSCSNTDSRDTPRAVPQGRATPLRRMGGLHDPSPRHPLRDFCAPPDMCDRQWRYTLALDPLHPTTTAGHPWIPTMACVACPITYPVDTDWWWDHIMAHQTDDICGYPRCWHCPGCAQRVASLPIRQAGTAGRGALLICGDVEQNPGPPPRAEARAPPRLGTGPRLLGRGD